MAAPQHVFRVRRNYNQWVANQTLEDYALRFTSKAARKWSSGRVALTALGAISFLALEAIGGAITLHYGFVNAISAILVVSAIIFLAAIPICYYATKCGIDIDLLTRGAGFGYIGSTVTSLIYASFTFIFFALEAAIMALALELTLNIPVSIGYVLSSLVVIPLVTHGITLISRFQVWTQPIWMVFQLLPLICIAIYADDSWYDWITFPGSENGVVLDNKTPSFDLIAFGAASAVLFALIAQIGEQVDFIRFIPHQEKKGWKWWCAMLSAGPGWIIPGVLKILLGSFLTVLALNYGVPFSDAADPNHMYLTAFSFISESPQFTFLLLGLFVIISQIKINVTNAYAGSIAWSNFFSRLTHHHPGRVVWLVFNVMIALVLMELGIYRILEEILGGYSIIALSWVGAIVADLTVNQILGLRPKRIEFKRAHLYDINPVGIGSMLIACLLGFSCYGGWFGPESEALASYIAFGSTFIAAPLIAFLTDGKYYIAREPVLFSDAEPRKCCICENHFDPEDMTQCPAYKGDICSLCCSLDSRCGDMCKSRARLTEQLTDALSVVLPSSMLSMLSSQLGRFLGVFFVISLVTASALSLVYFQVSIDQSIASDSFKHALVTVFFILLIIIGVVSWMFTLAHESRLVAQNESENQTKRLLEEIAAHERTDLQLQKAKEQAESANLAKSRYLTGISHELRSPLNSILGYAQLLEKDTGIPKERRGAINIIKRSSEHLSDLIEGLLDISRIEAGKLELHTHKVSLNTLLDEIVSMFSMQAEEKGLYLTYSKLNTIPDVVKTDQKRLRQILINLLSNAVKYTNSGGVEFNISYKNQVAEFTIIDTGIGIDENKLEQIFNPFERIREPGQTHVTGTGLGLTITRLLVEIMGGNITIASKLGEGSRFSVSLLLSDSNEKLPQTTTQQVTGYDGAKRTIFVVDDEPDHRSLLSDFLEPLGFGIIQAPDAESCFQMISNVETAPDLFVLDVFMPGMSGSDLAVKLKELLPQTPILMVSANAQIQPPETNSAHDGYLIKPINYEDLLEQVAGLLRIKWRLNQDPLGHKQTHTGETNGSPSKVQSFLSAEAKAQLIHFARIGYLSAIREELSRLYQEPNNYLQTKELDELELLANSFRFADIIAKLEVKS